MPKLCLNLCIFLTSYLALACSKLIIERWQYVMSVQSLQFCSKRYLCRFWCVYCYHWTNYTHRSVVSIVDSEQVNGGWVLASKFLWNVLSHAVLTGNHLWEETRRETLQQISVNAIEKISWMDHLSGVPHVGWSAKSLQLCYHLFTGLKDTITLLQH